MAGRPGGVHRRRCPARGVVAAVAGATEQRQALPDHERRAVIDGGAEQRFDSIADGQVEVGCQATGQVLEFVDARLGSGGEVGRAEVAQYACRGGARRAAP